MLLRLSVVTLYAGPRPARKSSGPLHDTFPTWAKGTDAPRRKAAQTPVAKISMVRKGDSEKDKVREGPSDRAVGKGGNAAFAASTEFARRYLFSVRTSKSRGTGLDPTKDGGLKVKRPFAWPGARHTPLRQTT